MINVTRVTSVRKPLKTTKYTNLHRIINTWHTQTRHITKIIFFAKVVTSLYCAILRIVWLVRGGAGIRGRLFHFTEKKKIEFVNFNIFFFDCILIIFFNWQINSQTSERVGMSVGRPRNLLSSLKRPRHHLDYSCNKKINKKMKIEKKVKIKEC